MIQINYFPHHMHIYLQCCNLVLPGTGTSFPYFGALYNNSLPPTAYRLQPGCMPALGQFWPPTPPPDGKQQILSHEQSDLNDISNRWKPIKICIFVLFTIITYKFQVFNISGIVDKFIMNICKLHELVWCHLKKIFSFSSNVLSF